MPWGLFGAVHAARNQRADRRAVIAGRVAGQVVTAGSDDFGRLGAVGGDTRLSALDMAPRFRAPPSFAAALDAHCKIPSESAPARRLHPAPAWPTATICEGTFSTDRLRRRERAWQRVGVLVAVRRRRGGTRRTARRRRHVAHAAAVYLFLLVVFRVSGRRTLAQVTTFDLILVLILGDATQDALIGERATFATAVVAVATLVLIDIALARAKRRWPAVDVLVDGLPLPLVVHGQLDARGDGLRGRDARRRARRRHAAGPAWPGSRTSVLPSSSRTAASRSCLRFRAAALARGRAPESGAAAGSRPRQQGSRPPKFGTALP